MLDYCGPCHARRSELTSDFKPGDDFLDDHELTIVDYSETYYADGQIHEEDYEYASFLSSNHSGGKFLYHDIIMRGHHDRCIKILSYVK